MPIDLTDLDSVKNRDEYVCTGCNTIRKIGKACRQCFPEVDNYE